MHIADVADRSSFQACRVSEEVRKLLKTGDAMNLRVCHAKQLLFGPPATILHERANPKRRVNQSIKQIVVEQFHMHRRSSQSVMALELFSPWTESLQHVSESWTT